MKKYQQITVVLALFFLLVFVKRISNAETKKPEIIAENPAVMPKSTEQQGTPNSMMQPESKPMAPNSGTYRNGSYLGSLEDASYGEMQVRAIITSGKLTSIEFLQYPDGEGATKYINEMAMPELRSEAISAQSAEIDGVTGASYTSEAFRKSLASALSKAAK